ncbi:MAG: radical SAM protein [Bacteroidetes bacterium]|jgi:histone acetyltransferase (RNA polymerase elongator complex component)|nr:radical SAM protein [Bacteroidota bacterium]
MSQHYNIPVFLPELACPHRCVFCNQTSISGMQHIPSTDDLRTIVESHLSSFKPGEKSVELAFFGGNFTGLPEKMQLEYLQEAQPWLTSGKIQGIRLSTRPDYISHTQVRKLKAMGVTHIELGAQSTDDEVLQKSGRGHNREAIVKASAIIREAGMVLGLQMMIGLPGDSLEKALTTATDIISWGAEETRIYPCLVVRDTVLETLYKKQTYQPLSLSEAIEQAAIIYTKFETSGLKVLRIGLHASDDLNGSALIAGPYHANFAEMVFSKIWLQQFEDYKHWPETPNILIQCAPSQLNHAVGYKALNKKWLLQRYIKVRFKADSSLSGRQFKVQKLLL